MKICIDCGVQGGHTLFHKNKRLREGLSNICKLCSNKRKKAWDQKNNSAYGGAVKSGHATKKAVEQAFIAKHGKDVADILNDDTPERHDLSEFIY